MVRVRLCGHLYAGTARESCFFMRLPECALRPGDRFEFVTTWSDDAVLAEATCTVVSAEVEMRRGPPLVCVQFADLFPRDALTRRGRRKSVAA